MKKLYNTTLFYAVLGLAIGVFYREYTKFMAFDGITVLGKGHGHTLALGFMFFLIVLLLEKVFLLSNKKYFNAFYYTYNIGLISTISTMIVRGILQINKIQFNGLSHISGLTHLILGAGFILFLMNLKQALKKEF